MIDGIIVAIGQAADVAYSNSNARAGVINALTGARDAIADINYTWQMTVPATPSGDASDTKQTRLPRLR